MLYCQSCHRRQLDGTLICDNCGADLVDMPSALEEVAVPVGAGPLRADANAVSEHLAEQLAPTQKLPGRLGVTRGQQTPHSLPAHSSLPPRPPADMPTGMGAGRGARGRSSTAPRCVVLLHMGKHVFELAEQRSYLIGRHDPEKQIYPDIDLHAAHGAARGVSRRHVAIHITGNTASIEDLESRNCTILNGFRLLPYQHYPLIDGDDILLGNIPLSVEIRAAL